MTFNSGSEFVTAVIDLLTGLILVPLCFILAKTSYKDREMKKGWLTVMSLLSVGNILGFIAHSVDWPEVFFDSIWVVLYPVMFGIVAFFGLLTFYFVSRGKHPTKIEKTRFLALTLAFSVEATVVGFLTVDDILIFVYYGGIVGIPSFIAYLTVGLKRKTKSGLFILLALIPQLVGFPFQLLRRGRLELFVTFDHNGIYHICLMVSVVLLFCAAYSDRITEFDAERNDARNSPEL